MMFFKLIKRIWFFSILLFVANIYGQETIIPLTEGGWVGGLSGNVGWDDYDGSGNSNTVKVAGFGFSFSSRNGRFVMNNLSVGFDVQWDENKIKTTYKSTPTFDENSRLGFIGLWSRYYIPFIGSGWAIFSEVSLGYANYKLILDYHSALEVPTREFGRNLSANGLAYNLGLGATMFVSNNVAFETTARYQGGKLAGDNNIEIVLSNTDIIFGIMIYLK